MHGNGLNIDMNIIIVCLDGGAGGGGGGGGGGLMTVRQVGSRADRGVHLVRLECVCRQLTLSGQSASDCAGEKSDNIATRH